ncbi:MAG: PTS glucose transporter subunit IIA, partial [Erysipelotrichaceae bacterium]
MALFNFKKKNLEIVSPVSGNIIPNSQIQDPVFATEMMGKTVAIEPDEEDVVCPIDGTVEALFPTGHAFGITSKNGLSLLVHIGINTVNLNGEGFKTFITQGQKVKTGDKAIQFNAKLIKEKGCPLTTMLIVTENPENLDI